MSTRSELELLVKKYQEANIDNAKKNLPEVLMTALECAFNAEDWDTANELLSIKALKDHILLIMTEEEDVIVYPDSDTNEISWRYEGPDMHLQYHQGKLTVTDIPYIESFHKSRQIIADQLQRILDNDKPYTTTKGHYHTSVKDVMDDRSTTIRGDIADADKIVSRVLDGMTSAMIGRLKEGLGDE